MAEITAFRNNALNYPVYGVPWTVVVPLLDEDGDPTTGLTCDSEVSINGETGADCTNEATEIAFTTATNKGMYYLTLTAAEMTGDIITVTIYSGATTTQATCIVLYPRKLVTLATGTSQGGAAGYITLAAGAVVFNGRYDGCLCVATIDSAVEARVLQVCTSSNDQCTVTPGWNVAPDADDTYIIYNPEGRAIATSNVRAISDDLAAADNLESACDNYSATRGLSGTALPAAAADAAGGITISDAGGLDMDALNASIAAIKAAQILVQTTIAADGRTPTSCRLTAGADHDDAYNGCIVILDNNEGTTQPVARRITDYAATNKVVTWERAIDHDAKDGGAIYIVAESAWSDLRTWLGVAPLALASQRVQSDMVAVHGSALTETGAGYLAAAIVKLFDVATPGPTMNTLALDATITTRIPQVMTMAQVGGTGAYYVVALGSAGTGAGQFNLSSGVIAASGNWSTLTQTQVSGGAYDLTNATYVAALKSGLGTIPASGNWSTHSAADVVSALGTGSGLTACLTATGFATPTNITAASGISLAASQHVIVDSGTVTTLTNAPTITLNASTTTGVFAGTVLANAPTGTGSGLTAQQTRDAMKLAPTAGTPDAGSIDAHLDTIQTDAATAAGGSSGTGEFAINHNSGGTNALAALYNAAGIAGIKMTAYLSTDYAAGNQGSSFVRGTTTTNDSGGWINSMMLNAGTYTIRGEDLTGTYGVTTKTLTISATGTATVTA
jgi:hypothetical protein